MKANIAPWTIIIFGLASLYLVGGAAQKQETKIIFSRQEIGFNFYEVKPAGAGNSDGSFESTTEVDIQGGKIRSRLRASSRETCWRNSNWSRARRGRKQE